MNSPVATTSLIAAAIAATLMSGSAFADVHRGRATVIVRGGPVHAAPPRVVLAHGYGYGYRGGWYGGGVRYGVYVGGPWYGWPGYYGYPYAYPYSYPPSVITVPASPPTYVEQPAAAPVQSAPAAPQPGYWYYCADARAYYPYVKECPAGWQRVAPQPPGG